MRGKSNPETTTEDIRGLIGAPKTDQPLVTENEFSLDEVRSTRPPWTMPLPKLGIVGIALVPVFAIAALFLMGRNHTAHRQEGQPPQTEQHPGSASQSTTESDQIARLQQENAQLKATAALEDQQQVQNQPRPSRRSPAMPTLAARTPSRSPSATPPPPSRTVSQPSTAPPQILTAPEPVRPVASRRAIQPNESIDPMQQWQQLVRLGSYGSIRPDESLTPEFSSSQPSRISERQGTLVASVPTAQIAPTSTRPATPSIQDHAPILEDAEAAILGEQQRQALIAGTRSAGVLASPLILDGSENRDRFTVVLTKPLMDSRGGEAFPIGTQLLIRVDRISDTGLVQLSATTATWAVNGLQQELTLPGGIILIRGEDGNPLIAEQFEDRGGEIAGMEAGQFLLGAIRRSAQLFTRSDTRVQTGEGTTVITENNPAPNILAGALEGGTDAILDRIAERNQRAIERMENLPNVRFVEGGRPVQIFVNQSMLMPMEQRF